METRTNLPPETPRRKLAFHYDSQGRRTEKTVLTLNTNAQWETASTHHFLYDGWNLLSEISYSPSDIQTNTRWFVWGLDLSGTLQGAGGIGGLLAQISGGTTAPASVFFPAYDANGNITEYISTTGTIAARFAYDPFGNTIAQTGTQADTLPYRFSTKYTDNETGLVYYGYRFYSPELGRWPNRDPIGEDGGLNVYGFLNNRPIDKHDYLGLWGNNNNSPPNSARPPKLATKECCKKVPYDPKFQCCVNGVVTQRGKQPSGIKKCCLYTPGYGRVAHCQVHFKGKAYGKSPSSGWWGSAGKCGQEAAPFDHINFVNNMYYPLKCENIMIDACKYDMNKIEKCLDGGGGECGTYNLGWADCRHWADTAGNCLKGNEL